MRTLMGSICLVVGIMVSGCTESNRVTADPATPTPWVGKLSLGSTRGQMTDPVAHEWQTELLQAMGRDGQYALFNYVFVDAPGGPNVYVGVESTTLGLTPDEVDAVSAVQSKYAELGTMMRDGIWMAAAWPAHEAKAIAAN